MINDTLIWLLIVPILGAVAVWWFTGHKKENLAPAALYAVISCVIVTFCFFISKGVATADVEIWNGQVTSKNRQHDSYKRPYDCNCRSVSRCSGSGSSRSCTSDRVCDTCWEDRYTVTWSCYTTIGTYTIQHLDTTSRSVYATPDPARYSVIKIGDPVSKRSTYTNYVQAVPQSLFATAAPSVRARFVSLIPPYPDGVYDFYKLDRFLTPGYSSTEAGEWNSAISELLKERGPRKQVNAIVVVAKTDDPSYVHALQDAWEGANKNDVVLVIGSAQWPKIDFVEVISWTKRELFKVQLRDEVMAIGAIEREPILKVLAHQIDTNFERRRMREFEYLQAEIDPPTWLLLFLLTLMIAAVPVQIYFFNGKSWTPRTAISNGRPLRRY